QRLGVPVLGDELSAAFHAVWCLDNRFRSLLAAPFQTDWTVSTTHLSHWAYLPDGCTVDAIHLRQLQRPRLMVAGAAMAHLLLGVAVFGRIVGASLVWIEKAR